ncbi:hypothetical protein Lser_V15G03451 [Lactuca serriola]
MVVLSELLSEGSSCSSSTHVQSSSTHDHISSIDGHRYDIFLSFRGLDTRLSFTNYLHDALIEANITTFLDDEEIETGEDLKPELESAIKASRASIIVLSENYATSTWCLDELVLILEQRMTSNHIVIPIFYHVEPTHVRKQQSSFGNAMAKHKQTMDAETNANKRSQWAQKIDRWNKALTEVSNLKGKDIKGRLQTMFIKEIVKYIHRRLHVPLRTSQPLLIGMEYHIHFVTSWLNDKSSHTADILTILGIGGIGKTSLAKHVYGLYSHEFQTSSFIEDIARKCDGKFNGLLDLQNQLYNDISKTILDDITTLDQLDALLGSKGFHRGSKIIITTRNRWLTESCALFKTNIKPKNERLLLFGLDEIQSQQLLCFHAFMCNYPKEGYEEMSYKLVKYCQGHPLSLAVLGKSLYNRDVAYWKGCLEGLNKKTSSHVNNVLRMSFDSLPSNNDKELFKHIACFFVGIDRDVSETIIMACDIITRSGITNLIDRYLLSIGSNNELKMHQLVQEMGRFEVHQESFDKPWKRSRIWCHNDSFRVLKQKKGKGNVLGLSLDMRMLEKENLGAPFDLKTDALSNMDSLMLLQMNYVHMNGSYENFPDELRGLCMHGFRLKCIPLELPMMNLVALDMSYSYIESFVGCYSNTHQLEKRQKLDGLYLKDNKLLGSLKILNLSFCKQLHSLGDFDQFPALERLIVRNCIGLVEVGESIEKCVELVFIDLSNCKKLEKLPRNIGMLKNVKTLLLDGCNLSDSQTEDMDMVINIRTSSSSFMGAISSDLKLFTISLPRSLVRLSLVNNNLSTDCFPMNFSCLSMLKELYLDYNPINSMPSCMRTIPRLEILSMANCKKLKSVEYPPRTLNRLLLFSRLGSFVRKVEFDPEMSPLEVTSNWWLDFTPGSYEIEGMIKIQAMVGVEEKVLRSLGWINEDFLNKGCVGTNPSESKVQRMFYEFGIFSTKYEVEEMPRWFKYRSLGPSISFTIPSSSSSSPNNLIGLNFCYLHTLKPPDESLLFPHDQFPSTPIISSVVHDMFPSTPITTIHNITKNHTWIYERHLDGVIVDGKCWVMLSHWMFRMNEMEAGDHVTITVTAPYDELVKECGVSLVYEDEEEEDALGYYKSWNHIIGGDLSQFQTTTGQYILQNRRFFEFAIYLFPYLGKLIPDGPTYQGHKEVSWFRAFSQRNPGLIGSTHVGKGESSRSHPSRETACEREVAFLN